MDKEYTAGEAKAWLNGYDEGKKIRMSERSIQISDKKEAESARAWVGLTDEEYTELWGKKPFLLNFFRKIEAKLKEKNT
jgi:hypothetical protein